jgi:hypothetical protein
LLPRNLIMKTEKHASILEEYVGKESKTIKRA